MMRSNKKRLRDLAKRTEWALKEVRKDIDLFLAQNECPGAYVSTGIFATWDPFCSYRMRGMTNVGEHILLLDIVPRLVGGGGTVVSAVPTFLVLTHRGVGYISFEKHLHDGGIHARVARVLKAT